MEMQRQVFRRGRLVLATLCGALALILAAAPHAGLAFAHPLLGPPAAKVEAAQPGALRPVTLTGGCGAPSFGPPRFFPVGQPPSFTATADFNHDGFLDLVASTISDATPNVTIMLGADGGFGLPQHYPTGDGPRAIAIGDFNHDGNPDLATADSSDFPANVSVLLGDGAGGFGPATHLTAGTTAWDLATGDFNHDNNLDLVVANFNSANVSVFFGDGTGGFSPAHTMHVGTRPAAAVVGDFNGDTNLDFAVGDSTANVVWVVLGDGMGGFGPPTSFAGGTQLASLTAGDVNQDGILDLLTANPFVGTLSLLLGQGDGTFGAPYNIAVPGSPNRVAVADLNADGIPDLAVTANGPDSVLVLTGDGAGGFAGPVSFPAGSQPASLAVGDYNGDGRPDLATANVNSTTLAVLLNDCVGPPTETPSPTATATPPATETASPTATGTAPAQTSTPAATGVPASPTATGTPVPPATPTPCQIQFSDVHPADYFAVPVRYLACHGVVSGYGDGTFRPYQQTTRAQMVKIVVLGFGRPITTPAGGAHTFADVGPNFPFFSVIETAAAGGIVSGYTCGGSGEPCDPQGRPYFRPYLNVTRAQLSKIVVVAAGWPLQRPPAGTFADVLPADPFYAFVETAANHAIISGYTCGGPGEPCDPQQRPFFRAANPATRGQIAKIVYGALIAALRR